MSTKYEAPHCATFSILLLLHPSLVQIFSFSNTLSLCSAFGGTRCITNKQLTVNHMILFISIRLICTSIMFRIVFCDILPCKMIVDRRFRGAYCLHRSTVILHGSISQKTILNIILAVVRTLNLTCTCIIYVLSFNSSFYAVEA
jgi:hypothetical protein